MQRVNRLVLITLLTLGACTRTTSNEANTAGSTIPATTSSAPSSGATLATSPTTTTTTTTSLPVAPLAPSSVVTVPPTAVPTTTPPLADPIPPTTPARRNPRATPERVYGLWDAPQLGTEPVRGSGCGADGSLGNVIPDGWWYGYPDAWGPNSIPFDVICVYYGESAKPFIAECWATAQDEADEEFCAARPAFWIENNNTRKRTVPISPDLLINVDGQDVCPEVDPRDGSPEALIHIVNGQAVYFATWCGGG